jgi:hypothetical protein
MNIGNKWTTAIICGLVAIICALGAQLFLRSNAQEKQSATALVKADHNAQEKQSATALVKAEHNAKPSLPIEARFVSFGGKNYLKITAKTGTNLESEIEVQISKWRGSDSKHEKTVSRLIKKDVTGIYFQTPPDPNVVPDYYAYRIRFPDLFYTMSMYSSQGRGYFRREYATYLPGDTVKILNSLCEPIVIQCPLKVSEQSDIKPETEGKIDFVRK